MEEGIGAGQTHLNLSAILRNLSAVHRMAVADLGSLRVLAEGAGVFRPLKEA